MEAALQQRPVALIFILNSTVDFFADKIEQNCTDIDKTTHALPRSYLFSLLNIFYQIYFLC